MKSSVCMYVCVIRFISTSLGESSYPWELRE